MQKITGEYAAAMIYSDTVEEYAATQVKMICDNSAASGSRIRVMPDVHPGNIGPIGLTMTIGDKIMPGLVGTDIGCGISYIRIKKANIEFQKLDKVIREKIPVGSHIRKEPHRFSVDFDFGDLICRKCVNDNKAVLSLGTLESGNHFIEVDIDETGQQYIAVHTGSRSLGAMVAGYYMKKGHELLKQKGIDVSYEMTYLEGQLMEDYIHDASEVQGFAMLNREIILSEIAKSMKWKETGSGGCIHNYIAEDRILRKGAVSAYENDDVIIPVNMKDGIIIGTGKGNAEWNCSAPHGAGRILSRTEAQNQHTLSEFKAAVKGIHFSNLSPGTLSEAPFAYRGLEEIIEAIKDTVEVKKILKPVYNFKADERK